MPAIVFDPKDSRIACFPHIINICVQHTLEALAANVVTARASNDDGSNNDGSNDDGSNDDDSEDDGSDDEGCTVHARVPDDLLVKVRKLIKAIRASGQRQAEFSGVIESGNKAGWWKSAEDMPAQIKPLKLILDVKTRWDSTYQMLIRLRMFKQVR